jgi:hypothetical protein
MRNYVFQCGCIYRGIPNGKEREFYWIEIWSCGSHQNFEGQKTNGSSPARLKAKYIKVKDLKLLLSIQKMKVGSDGQ